MNSREYKEYLTVPQAIFNILTKHFEGVALCGVNGPTLTGNICWLQEAAGLPRTGRMDPAAWEVLSRLYKLFVLQDINCQPAFTGGWG